MAPNDTASENPWLSADKVQVEMQMLNQNLNEDEEKLRGKIPTVHDF